MANGVVAIQHGNSHKIPHNAFPLDLYKRVENFLRIYLNADKHSNKSIVLSQPLSKVFHDYKEYDKDAEQHMGYSTFRTFFKKQFPQVRQLIPTAKPQTSTVQHPLQFVEDQFVEVEVKLEGGIVCTSTDDLIYYDDGVSHEEVIDEDNVS